MIGLLSALLAAFVVLRTSLGEAHRTSTGRRAAFETRIDTEPSHGQTAVISNILSAIRALASFRIGFDMTTWRLKDYLNLQSFTSRGDRSGQHQVRRQPV